MEVGTPLISRRGTLSWVMGVGVASNEKRTGKNGYKAGEFSSEY